MSDLFRVAIIGCEGPAAHAHARGYLNTGECELVAVADTRRERSESFVTEYGTDVQVYDDYQDLFDDERPDIVSICLGPKFQPSAVLDAASADVRAIHGETPLAPTWGEAKAMRKAAGQKGIQLTFNLAQRFLPSMQAARELIRTGRFGELQRLEGDVSDLFTGGPPLLDLFHFCNDDISAEWVLGQVESRTERTAGGVRVEDQSLAELQFRNGVRGLLRAHTEAEGQGLLRLTGTHGSLEWHEAGAALRYQSNETAGWCAIPDLALNDWGTATALGIADLVQCLDTGDEPELSSERALRCTELVFAIYESSRKRGRVRLPLQTEDNAFLAMLAAGEIGV